MKIFSSFIILKKSNVIAVFLISVDNFVEYLWKIIDNTYHFHIRSSFLTSKVYSQINRITNGEKSELIDLLIKFFYK